MRSLDFAGFLDNPTDNELDQKLIKIEKKLGSAGIFGEGLPLPEPNATISGETEQSSEEIDKKILEELGNALCMGLITAWELNYFVHKKLPHLFYFALIVDVDSKPEEKVAEHDNAAI